MYLIVLYMYLWDLEIVINVRLDYLILVLNILYGCHILTQPSGPSILNLVLYCYIL